MNVELKPCPFCGEKVYVSQNPLNKVWEIEHSRFSDDCPYFISFYDTREEAVEVWNRRA